ncbi:unnamed protein product [Rhizoctonia solani]|uniref:Peptidase C14 caspase domain-containing protein n=1 Tax=Rhizoctonia solani TaxID=456999 RepID=A0A8H3HBM6_9AGAM|nr:unnamed protein product [Rhizoctonia solani]
MVFPTYSGHLWPDDDKAMEISKESVENDITRITKWTGQFNNRTLKVYRDAATGTTKGSRAPNAINIRRLLGKPRDDPTFIYVSGHTDCVKENSVYLPSDCIEGKDYSTSRVIPYAEFRDKMCLERHQAPTILVTDFCNPDNVLKLPYAYSYANEKVTCTETGYDTGSASVVIHFAAASPHQPAAFFPEFGSPYNFALHTVDLSEGLSLERIVQNVQIQMDEFPENHEPQQHWVYSSHKFGDEDFFLTLGFSSKRPSQMPTVVEQ